jgi:hypothetical protein
MHEGQTLCMIVVERQNARHVVVEVLKHGAFTKCKTAI